MRLKEISSIHAAWLEGSFGRGTNDRWSDIDLHLLVNPNDSTDPEQYALRLKPHSVTFLHVYSVIPKKICQVVGEQGVRLDVVVHRAEAHTIYANSSSVLHDPYQKLIISKTTNHPSADMISARLSTMIHEFWRIIYMVPVVLGRNEIIVAHQGIVLAAALLGQIFALASGQNITTGVKRLETFLSAKQSARLRYAVRGPFEDSDSIVQANARLIDIMRAEGPTIAARFGFPYPGQFETAVLEYLKNELELLRLSH